MGLDLRLELAGAGDCCLTPRTAAHCFENAFCSRILLWSVCLSGSSGTNKPHTQTPHRQVLTDEKKTLEEFA